MEVRIQEAALRRYAERCEVPEVEFAGRFVKLTLCVRIDQEAAKIEARGRREFGGWVSFEPPDPTAARGAMPRLLARSTKRMIEAFARLCICGRPADSCDCCVRCGGRGLLPGRKSARACEVCGGLGYEG